MPARFALQLSKQRKGFHAASHAAHEAKERLRARRTVGREVGEVGATTLAEVLPTHMGATTLDAVAEIAAPRRRRAAGPSIGHGVGATTLAQALPTSIGATTLEAVADAHARHSSPPRHASPPAAHHDVGHDDGCPPGKIRNPATGRCVNADGKIGRSILGGGQPAARVHPAVTHTVPMLAHAAPPGYDGPTVGYDGRNMSRERCTEIPHGKWSGGASRKAPPFHARPCAGQTKVGLDGKLWESREVGIDMWRWMPKRG